MKFIEEYKRVRQNAIDQLKTALLSESQSLFDKYPELVSFSFVGYSPYFNDGDECIYHYREYLTEINGDETGEYSSRSNRFYNDNENATFPAWYGDAYQDFWKLIHSIPSEIMLDSFEDHVRITIYRDRIDRKDYTDHD